MTATVGLSVLDEYGGTRLLTPERIRWVQPVPLPSKIVDVAFKEAMAAPLGAKPFDKEKCWSPGIIVSDYTRKYSPFVSRLISMIEPKTDDIKIIFAGGTHIPSEPDFMKKVLGEEVHNRYQKSIRVSSTKNPGSKYEWIGVTTRGTPLELNKELFDRDLLISTLNVQPHYFAGFEGGAKALLPGCSGLKTITTNHGYVIGNPSCRELAIRGNALREDMNEVPGVLRESMKIEHRILDFVLNQDGSMVRAAYGDPNGAHQQLAENYSGRAHAVTSTPSPLVLTVADGPTGRNLYQALKAAAFASNLTVPNNQPKSTVILVGGMEDGVGGEAFKSEMELYGRMEPDQIIEDLKKRAKTGKVTEASQKPNRLSLDDRRADLIVVSPKAPGSVEELLAKTRIKFFRSIDDALGSLDKRLYERDVAVIPHGSSTVPLPR